MASFVRRVYTADDGTTYQTRLVPEVANAVIHGTSSPAFGWQTVATSQTRLPKGLKMRRLGLVETTGTLRRTIQVSDADIAIANAWNSPTAQVDLQDDAGVLHTFRVTGQHGEERILT